MIPATLPAAEAPNADTAWDEAFLRVESYLRAHQIESRLLLNRLVVEIINAARERALADAASASASESASAARSSSEAARINPLALAMHEAELRTNAWFTRVLGDAVDPDDERLGTRGRIALVLADVPARWPQYFLAATPPPPDLVDAMRAAYIEAGPEMEVTRMVPRPLDFGPIANVADEAWRTFRRWPLLRAIVVWLLFIGLLAAAWRFTH